MNILITGAASGIGYLTALTLAKRNHSVYLTCHTDLEVEIINDKIKDYENITVLKIDVTDEEDRKTVLDLNVDCLISNAAICQGGSIIEVDIDKMKDNFNVNVFSNFLLVREVLKQMIEKDSGRIIMISSIISSMPLAFAGIYSATKASVSNITYSLKKELWLMGSNVEVALVEPGLYHTGFNDILLDSKYNNGIYFSDIKKELYTVEHYVFNLLEKKELDSIVVQIIRAVEDKKLKKVYRAPLLHVILSKLYGIIK